MDRSKLMEELDKLIEELETRDFEAEPGLALKVVEASKEEVAKHFSDKAVALMAIGKKTIDSQYNKKVGEKWEPDLANDGCMACSSTFERIESRFVTVGAIYEHDSQREDALIEIAFVINLMAEMDDFYGTLAPLSTIDLVGNRKLVFVMPHVDKSAISRYETLFDSVTAEVGGLPKLQFKLSVWDKVKLFFKRIVNES